MSFSGVNSSNCVPVRMAKVRTESGIFTKAESVGVKGDYRIRFVNPVAQWNGEALMLSSSRAIHTPKIFKSLDGAVSDLRTLGVSKVRLAK